MEDLILNDNYRPEPLAHRGTILIGEDDSEVQRYLELALRCQGYTVKCAGNGNKVMDHLGSNDNISAVLLDIMMPEQDGFETLRKIRRSRPTVPVIMVSAMSTPANVIRAIKSGAADFLSKPVTHSDLSSAIQHALEGTRQSNPETPIPEGDVFYGTSRAMQEIRGLAPAVAAGDIPVLILGETGTGKEALARQIHALSPRADKPFVKLNCAAVPSELIESELFGYEKGAFTGAVQRKQGLFELADEGTILLDEIGDMDFRLQAKLLQVLQDGEFRRVGGRETVRVDVRVIAATHRNLEKGITTNTFREDLYYRLNVCTFVVPPLRERRGDIPALAEHLIRRHAGPEQASLLLTADVVDALRCYEWPGNVRELENMLRKLITLKEPDLLVKDLRRKAGQLQVRAESGDQEQTAEFRRTHSPTTFEEVSRSTERAEAAAIREALDATRWNRKKAAVRLKIDYKALLYKMKKLNLDNRVTLA